MARPDVQVGSKIKVVDKKSPYYRWRGNVTEEIVQTSLLDPTQNEVVGFICVLNCQEDRHAEKVEMKPGQIACIQKKFIDIEHIRGEDVDLGNGIVRKNNVGAFEVGDQIQITTKIDGANASIAYNADEGKLEVFSRTNLLAGADDLRGFKPFIDIKFKSDEFAKFPDLVVFGEWLVPHKINDYEKCHFNNWHVYDIWNKSAKNYMPQSFVKEFCKEHGMSYVEVLYEGPFVSWNHCRTFMHASKYGPRQEGIVIKNQTKLDRDDIRFPKYLKIVNDEFKESMIKKEKKPVDPEILKAEQEAYAAMATVVTEARVHKLILKLIDEGKLDKDLKPQDMAVVCKHLPKMVWEDLLKEEPEILQKVGNLAGTACSKLTVGHCKKIIIGK